MHTAQMDMGVPQRIRDKATAYLVVVLEGSSAGRLDEDLAQLCELMLSYGAMDPYILDAGAARALIDIREKGFWTAKAAGANEVVDMVVPRAAMAEFFARARKLGEQTQSGVVGCGHAGDGNVHLAIFQDDNVARARLVRELCALSMDLGGAISGEHGIGRNKTKIFAELEDPARFAVMRTIKQALDPAGILNPGVMFASSC
jgi:glycolate oxidase